MADLKDIFLKVMLGEEENKLTAKPPKGQPSPKQKKEIETPPTKEETEKQPKVIQDTAKVADAPTTQEELIEEAVDSIGALKDLSRLIKPTERKKYMQSLETLHNILTGG